MASEQYTSDVMTVARAVYGSSRWREAVNGWSDETPDLSDLEVELAIPGNSLSSAIAGQCVVKLSFDAAILATVWALDDASPFDFARASESIEAHADDIIFSELDVGSFLARYRLDPRTETGRQRVFAVLTALGIALQYVSFIFPPATLPVLIVGTALAAPQILTNFFMPRPESEPPSGPSEEPPWLQLDLSRIPPGTVITITVPGDGHTPSSDGSEP